MGDRHQDPALEHKYRIYLYPYYYYYLKILTFNNNDDAFIEAETGDDQRPCIIWSLYFNTADSSAADLTCNDVKNLFVVGGPDSALDCDQAVAVVSHPMNSSNISISC